jgi:transposase
MARRTVSLTEEQRDELESAVRQHGKAYVRERAAAVLKVAAGEVAYQVALHGLLVRRDPDTVYGWLDRYQTDGLAGLTIRPGRGRKPTLSPPAAPRAGRAAGWTAAAAGERSA